MRSKGSAQRRPKTEPSSLRRATRGTPNAKPKQRKNLAEWVLDGDIFVSATLEMGELSSIRIEFHKETARIPSLKNSKLPGRNFLNPDTLNRLKAMDALYWRSTRIYRPQTLSFGDRPVAGLLVCNKRPTRFDLDNCVAAIKDWCEPATKRGRGWGVGLVNDDSRLNLFAVHAADIGLNLDHSLLVLKEWEEVGPLFKSFATRMFL